MRVAAAPAAGPPRNNLCRPPPRRRPEQIVWINLAPFPIHSRFPVQLTRPVRNLKSSDSASRQHSFLRPATGADALGRPIQVLPRRGFHDLHGHYSVAKLRDAQVTRPVRTYFCALSFAIFGPMFHWKTNSYTCTQRSVNASTMSRALGHKVLRRRTARQKRHNVQSQAL